MESRVNYTLVGFFVILMSIVLVSIAFWMTVGSRSKTYNNYLAFMQESVSGLSEQAPVKFNGVQVGYVAKIRLDKANPQLVKLLLKIEDETPITTSTRAMLMSQGITGIAYVGLLAVTPKAPKLTPTEGQKYPVIPSNPSLLVQLDKAIRDVTQNINEISIRLQHVLSPENERAFKETLAHINEFMGMISRNNLTIENGLRDIANTFKNTAVASQEFDSTLQSIRSASTQVDDAFQTLNEQAVPPAVSMMEQIQLAAKSLGALSQLLEEDPSTIIRGRAPAKPGPGE